MCACFGDQRSRWADYAGGGLKQMRASRSRILHGTGWRLVHNRWCRSSSRLGNPVAELLIPLLSLPRPATRLPVDALRLVFCTLLVRFKSPPFPSLIRGLRFRGISRGDTNLWAVKFTEKLVSRKLP